MYIWTQLLRVWKGAWQLIKRYIENSRVSAGLLKMHAWRVWIMGRSESGLRHDIREAGRHAWGPARTGSVHTQHRGHLGAKDVSGRTTLHRETRPAHPCLLQAYQSPEAPPHVFCTLCVEVALFSQSILFLWKKLKSTGWSSVYTLTYPNLFCVFMSPGRADCIRCLA